MLTGRSVTGILHFANKTPIDWFSKKQGTVETATYGSEFVAARTCVEQIMDLRLTLRYFGVPIHGKSHMFGDNKSVVDSSSVLRPNSTRGTRCYLFTVFVKPLPMESVISSILTVISTQLIFFRSIGVIPRSNLC